MSAFQISITPTRLRASKRKNENREPTDVILAPFSAKATVTFEDIPVTKTARRILNIVNPSDVEIKVMVTRSFKPEFNVTLEWTSNTLPPNSQIQMEMTWNPLKEMACKETLQITDSRNFIKDVAVILKSVKKNLSKTVKRYPNISSGPAVTKTLKLKSPTNIKSTTQQRNLKRQSMHKVRLSTEAKSSRKSEKTSPLLETNKYPGDHFPGQSNLTVPNSGKENISPVTPNSASSLFDKIQFTPALENNTKSPNDLDYLASLPTPVNRNTAEAKTSEHLAFNMKPRRISAISSPDDVEFTKRNQHSSADQSNCKQSPSRLDTPRRRPLPKIIVHPGSPLKDQFKAPFRSSESRVCSTVGNKILPVKFDEFKDQPDGRDESKHQLFEGQIINKTFELNDIKSDSILESFQKINSEYLSETPTLNRTTTLSTAPSRPLSIIEEEERSQILESSNNCQIQRTFNMTTTKCTEDLKRDVELVGTPLRKQSESMQNLSVNLPRRKQISIKGSMPNLNEMGAINPIEQNRYYQQQDLDSSDVSNTSMTSITSAVDLVFNQHEILAQSSRYNIHELGKSIKKTPSPTDRKIFKLGNTPPSGTKNSIASPKFIKENGTPTKTKCTPSPRQFSKRSRTKSIESPTSFLQVPIGRSIAMTVSPPKRTKIDPEYSADGTNKYGCNIRTSKWSKTQPKSLKFQKTLTLLKKPLTPRKAKPEARIMLYDSDIFLQTCINPDPFAATTTCDPFLASTMYLDERAVDKHETQFKKWLNALVAIPADFDSDCNQKVDVGRLFNEVRNKELTLAPTKEEQSMNYLTKSRMDSLRKAAVQLFMSGEMRLPCSKIAVLVNKQAIKIRVDRDLHLDVVMQRYILELLLSFNPLWLRIGLEVVFGEIIHLHSNSDVIGLSTFILNRLFRDKFLEQKYSRAYTLSYEYSEHIKKFTLQKFLFLLLFLDKAKTNRIIKHNPCLFMKKSQYKETKEILLRFSSELLANIGDITRDLRRVGYVLSHKQTFLDEFDYAFNNLAVDLRDGIRLTRVMEIILLRDDLSKQLRVPAISRLQRIFNVNLGLKSLEESNFSLTGNITAADIVDGHREKTLSLLWQIIYKFRAPKFNAAATVIQTWWRKSWLKVVINRRIRYKLEMQRHKAATVIQSAFRGYVARRYVEIFRLERTNAAICIQKYVRRYLAQTEYHKIIGNAIYIQRWYRCVKLTRETRLSYLYLKQNVILIQCWYRRLVLSRKLEAAAPLIHELKANAKLRHEKAIIIQRSLKSYTIRKKLQSIVQGIVRFNRTKKLQYKSAAKIQSLFRMIRLRKEFVIKRQAAISIQKHWRSYQSMKVARCEYLSKKNSTVAIQRYYRSYVLMKRQHQEYMQIKHCVTVIQNRFRANKLAKLERQQFLHKRECVIKVQQFFKATLKMRKDRAEYLNVRNLVIQIQRRYRANKEMQIQRHNYQKLKSAVMTIQQRYRAQALMRRHRHIYVAMRSSAIIIQTKLRATLLARRVRLEFLSTQYHTILIQQRFRANCLMRAQRAEFIQLKQSCVIIQQRFRAKILMQKQRSEFNKIKNAALVIQSRFKAYKEMRIQRAKYLGTREAAICIQGRFREYLLMKSIRQSYLQLRNAAVLIQTRFRAQKSMQVVREEYQNIKIASIIIQRRFRATQLMKAERLEYRKIQSAVLVIQRQFRANIARNMARIRYTQLKQATITLQRRFRAQQLMKTERTKYVQLRNATLKVQEKFRANKAMQVERTHYLRIRHSTINLQRRFRANMSRNIQRKQYINLKKAAVVIQTRFKALKAMRIERLEYLKLRFAAMTIQSRYRANKLMKLQRANYIEIKKSAILIQKKLRATKLRNIQRDEYLRLKESTLVIQRRFRARQAMKLQNSEYLQLRNATITIQRRFRANKSMRIQRDEFLQLKNSAITIQQHFRATKLRNIQRTYYAGLKNATLVIQSRFRARQEMHKARNEYQKLKTAAICIQRRYKANKAMQKQHTEFKKFKAFVVKIQQIYRAKKIGREVRHEYITLKTAVITIQRRYRAQQLMKLQLAEYEDQRYKIIILQRYIRSYLLSKRTRQEYVTKRISAIKIQLWFRGVQLMRQKRSDFQTTVKSALTIQKYLRATIQMRRERKRYLAMKEASIKIQRLYRSYRNMKALREEFQKLRQSAVIIQRRYRALREMVTARNQYLLIKSLTICIQRRFRANQTMKVQRVEYLKLKATTIFVQQKFRGRYLTEIYRQNFIEIRSTILGVQTHIRGFLARKRFNAMMTPEMREMIQRKRAAKVIQRFWRGYMVRKRKQSLKLRLIREKIKELKESARPGNALRYKITACVKFLKGRFNVQEAVSVLTRLENLSRTVPQTLMEHAEFIATFCYGIMAQAIRSEADKHIIELCSRVILNLARYDKANADHTFQENGLVTIAQMLLRWCDKDCGIFNTLCTLIWVFAHCPEKKKKIREFMTTHEAIYMVRETKKLILRKEKMRKNVRKLNIPSSYQTANSPTSRREFPSLEPDFGVVKNKPYTFVCSVFAFDAVLSTLGIHLV